MRLLAGTLTLSLATLALAACAGSTYGTTPALSQNVTNAAAQPDANLPKNTIGEELPTEGVGSTKDPTWGKVGGFTQTRKAQVLAFAPGTTVTIHNLSKTTPHTLDVVSKSSGPPANFPPNPSLSVTAKGNGVLGPGYASGAINAGGSVKVKLAKAGTYLIGCAFHYSEGMQDVLIVKAGATPGPSSIAF